MVKINSFRLDTLFVFLVSIALFVLSIVFYRERILYSDTTIYIHELIQSNSLWIATNRYVAYLSQILPWIGLQFGCSLQYLLILYSVNFILIPITCSVLCILWFKDHKSAISILLFYILSNNWLFYYPVSEFQMGLCLLIFYHSFVINFYKSGSSNILKFNLVSVLLITTIIFSHPLALICFGIWFAGLLVFWKPFRKAKSILIAGIAFISYVIKELFFKVIHGGSNYDDEKRNQIVNFLDPKVKYFDNQIAIEFWEFWLKHYFTEIALIVLVLFVLLVTKRFLLLLCYASSIFLLWLVVTVSFIAHDYEHYMEHMYQSTAFFNALMIGFFLFEIFPKAHIRFLVLILAGSLCINKIVLNHTYNSQRMEWYENYFLEMKKLGIRKAFISSQNIVIGKREFYFASYFESVLQSASKSPDSAMIIVVSDNVEDLNKMNRTNETKNLKYFNIPYDEKYYSLDSLLSNEEMIKLKHIKSK